MASANEAAFEIQSGQALEASICQEMEPLPDPGVVIPPLAAARARKSDGINPMSKPGSLSASAVGGTRAAASAGEVNLRPMHQPSRYDAERVIANDRDLLSALRLSDAVASTYVQKSRQTLNNQLGARKDPTAPTNYFKPAELLLLVLAASRDCAEFDEDAKESVKAYIAETRGSMAKSPQERAAYQLVMETLSSEGAIDLEKAEGVIFLLPDFLGMAAAEAEAVNALKRLAARLRAQPGKPWSLILSSSGYQSKMAAETLGLDGDVYPVSHDHAEHYMPAVLIYTGSDKPEPFVISGRGTFVYAPVYRAPMMLTCLKDMLPEALRAKLFQRRQDSQKQASR
jgi:hypothetical protein